MLGNGMLPDLLTAILALIASIVVCRFMLREHEQNEMIEQRKREREERNQNR